MVMSAPRQDARLSALIAKLAAGNLAYLGGQFVVFVVLAQFAPISEVGRFSWALALASPIFTLADMRTQQVQMTTRPEEYPYRVFLRQRVLAQVAAIVVALIAGYISAPDEATQMTLVAVICLKSVEGLLNVVLGEHMRREAMGQVAFLQILRSVVYVAAFTSLTVATMRADYAAAASAIALVIPAVVGHLRIPGKSRRLPRRLGGAAMLTRESMPLGVGFFIGSLTVNVPRFILEKYHGVDSLAVFAAVSYVVVLANTVVDSVSQGIMPRFAQYWHMNRRPLLLRATRWSCLGVGTIGLSGVTVAAFAGAPILSLLYGEQYRDGAPVLTVLMLSATLQYVASVLRSVLVARGMRTGVLFVSLANMTVTLVAALWTIGVAGAIAAAWSLVIGQAIQAGAYVALFRKVFEERAEDAE